VVTHQLQIERGTGKVRRSKTGVLLLCNPAKNMLNASFGTTYGRVQGHVTHFYKFCSNHIFLIGEAVHFKFRVLFDAEECQVNVR